MKIILVGSSIILSYVSSILIEIDQNQKKKSEKIFILLKKHGFRLVKEGSKSENISTVNQIWEKN